MVLDRYVLTFDIAGFIEAFAERGQDIRIGTGRPDEAHCGHGLLRQRRDWPRRSRAAEKRDEVAASHAPPR